MHSLKSDIPFPVPDSYPQLLHAEQPLRKFCVRASWTKSTIISEWARHLNTSTRYGLAGEERETISDQLQDLAEAYQAEMHSDDDSDD